MGSLSVATWPLGTRTDSAWRPPAYSAETPAARRQLHQAVATHFTQTGTALIVGLDFANGGITGLWRAHGAPRIIAAPGDDDAAAHQQITAVAERVAFLLVQMGLHVKGARMRAGVTQGRLADMLDTDGATIRNIETGSPRASPSPAYWARLVFALRALHLDPMATDTLANQWMPSSAAITAQWFTALRDHLYQQRTLKGLDLREVATVAGFTATSLSELERAATPPTMRRWLSVHAALQHLPSRCAATAREPDGTPTLPLYRALRGLKQADIAAALGHSRSWVKDREIGTVPLRAEDRAAIMRAINTHPRARLAPAHIRALMMQVFGPTLHGLVFDEPISPATTRGVTMAAEIAPRDLALQIAARVHEITTAVRTALRTPRILRRIPIPVLADRVPIDATYIRLIERGAAMPPPQLWAEISYTVRAMEYEERRVSMDPYILDEARDTIGQWLIALRQWIFLRRMAKGLRWADIQPWVTFNTRYWSLAHHEEGDAPPPLAHWVQLHAIIEALPSRLPPGAAEADSVHMLRITHGATYAEAAALVNTSEDAVRNHEQGTQLFPTATEHNLKVALRLLPPRYFSHEKILVLFRRVFGAAVCEVLGVE